MHSFYSNHTEMLFQHFKEQCFQASKPFQKRIVIVPSPSMKAWLMLQMATDPDLGIAMGVDILYLNQALQKLQPTHNQTLSEFELALAIEMELRNIFTSWSSLNKEKQTLWQPLLQYLKGDAAGKLGPKGERRLVLLCSTLSSLFIQYGTYGGKVVERWQDQEDWQKELWRIIFEKKAWNYPYRNLTTATRESQTSTLDEGTEIHLFALSFLPKIWFNYFVYLSSQFPIYIYLLSPCQAFWTDILSDKQSQKLLANSQHKKVSLHQLQELETYLRDRNSLLANYGRLGKEMALQIEESQTQCIQEYVLNKNILNYPHYGAFLTSDIQFQESSPFSMLHMVQSDVVLLRNPDEKIEFEKDDYSIQIHFSTDKLREVQNLHNTLLGIIQRHTDEASPISPKEILVMAPNINEYAPYIDFVFKGGAEYLEARIMDLAVPRKNAFIRAFLHLLSLPFTRWDASHLLQLFQFPSFQHCLGLTKEEVISIEEWIKRTEIRWGIDPQHRDELLQANHCDKGMLDSSSAGTWEYAINRLLIGLITLSEGESLPYYMDSTQGILLGKWIQVIRSLQMDLSPLHDGTELTLDEWVCFLKCLMDSYLKAEDKNDEQALLSYIDDFEKAERKLGKASFPFSTIKHHLENTLSRSNKSYHDGRLHAVTFCSLLPMRAIPAKVIAIIGMQENAYPKKAQNHSLNLMLANQLADFSPSSTDYDRFLYLETLLSAREYFLLSYQGLSDENGKEQLPSLLITELLNYLDNACVISGEKPSIKCFYKHPALSFDPIYFNQHSSLKSFSAFDFSLAKAFIGEKRNPPSFISDFSNSTDSNIDEDDDKVLLDIKEIENVVNNPIKAFLNKKMGIYIDKREKRIIKNEEEFYLNPLQKHILKKNAFNQSLENIVKGSEKEGRFPLGGFKNSAISQLQKEITASKACLMGLGVNVEDLFSIISSDDFSCVEKCDNGNWHLPPLRINYFDKTVSLTGNLSEVSVKGLISSLSDSKQDLFKIVPKFLFFHCLVEQFELPIQHHLLLLKGKGKIKSPFCADPFALLHHFIHFHFIASESVFPLIPEWIGYFLESEPEQIEIKIKESLKNPFKEMHNEEIKWIFQKENPFPSCSITMESWIHFAKNLYLELHTHW